MGNKAKFQSKRNNFSQVDRANINSLVSKKNDYDGTVVIFNNHDGSKRRLTTSDVFYKRKNGERLRISEIIQKLNSLRHDFHAKDYKIV